MIILPILASKAPSAIRSFLIQRIPISEIISLSLPNFGKVVRAVHKISNFDLNSIHQAAITADRLNQAFKFTNINKEFGKGFIKTLDQSPFNTLYSYRYEVTVFDGDIGRTRTVGYRIDSDFTLTKGEFNAITSEQVRRLEENRDKYKLFLVADSISLTGIFTQ